MSVASQFLLIALLTTVTVLLMVGLAFIGWQAYKQGSILSRHVERLSDRLDDRGELVSHLQKQNRYLTEEVIQVTGKALDALIERDAYITTRTESILQELRADRNPDRDRRTQERERQEQERDSAARSSGEPRSREDVESDSPPVPSPPPPTGGDSPSAIEELIGGTAQRGGGEHRARTGSSETDRPGDGLTDAEKVALRSLYRISRLRGDEGIALRHIQVVSSRSPESEGKMSEEQTEEALNQLRDRGYVVSEPSDTGFAAGRVFRLTEEGKSLGTDLDQVETA